MAAVGCEQQGGVVSHKSAPPAKVEAPPDETDLARITLTESAERRLGITTVPVERRKVARKRTLGGTIVVPAGSAVLVAAPVAGTLDEPLSGAIPVPGTRLAGGQPIFSLRPLLSPERYVPTPAEQIQMADAKASLASSRIVAEGEVERARAQVEAATISLNRAERLLRDKAGSQKGVDDAQAELNLTQRTLEAAEARRTMLNQLALEAAGEQAASMEIAAPQPGVLQSMSVARGQTVSAGTALFEVVNLDVVWIRVPVYVGQIAEVEPSKAATVAGLDGRVQREWRQARPIVAPPSADPLASTADLFYELENQDGALRPGERVSVTVPLRGEAQNLVVPWAAILHDIYGGTWVYEKVAQHTFRRQRVDLHYVTADETRPKLRLAVLAAGPPLGTQVVVDGAAELFGTEFGAGK